MFLTFPHFFIFGGATQNRTEDKSFADSCLTTWPWRRLNYINIIWNKKKYVTNLEQVTGIGPVT